MQPCFPGKINPDKLAVIAAFVTVVGDLLSLFAALLALQETADTKNNNKNQLCQQIDQLQKQLEDIKCKL